MGCSESKELEPSRFSSLFLDPEEESLHLKSWKDARTRQRVLCAGSTSLDNEEEAETIKISRKALAFHSALMRDESSSTLDALDSCGKGASRSGTCHVTKGENVGSALADLHSKEICSSADTVDGSEYDELRSRREQVEHDQEKDRLRSLLKVDPACWQGLAEQGYFQKAEDTLLDSSAAELKLIGRTARYAQCMHALGALYDQRSNLDVTGQQQLLSLTSADYALRALQVWDDLVRADPAAPALQEQQAASLLLRGRSLCNFAIDGDGCRGGGPTEDEAFAMAAADLGRALEIRERLGLAGLAEAVMAVGYLHYCRAGCLMRTGRHGPDGAELLPDYREALRHYTRSLNLYIDRDGQVGEGGEWGMSGAGGRKSGRGRKKKGGRE
jgi:tetratricopeptide (TPR) repeat protein